MEDLAGVAGTEKRPAGAGVAGVEVSCWTPGMLRAGEGGGSPDAAAQKDSNWVCRHQVCSIWLSQRIYQPRLKKT